MAQEVHRGEIWLFHHASPNKTRPVLVVSADMFNKVVRQVTIADITSVLRGSPAEVELGIDEGLKNISAVNLINLSTVPRSQLRHYVGRVAPDKMRLVCRALAIATGCT